MRRKYHLRYQGRFTRLASLARFLTAAAATRILLALTAPLLIMPASAQAQGNDPVEPCPGGGYNPTPAAVAVTAVPIVVESTTADYFVLYVSHDVDADTTVDIPVLVKRGEAGTTTLAENVEPLPKERYRVEKYLITDPADVDGDCIDDIAELADPIGMNPVNPAAAIALSNGAVAVPDHATFETLSYSAVYVKFLLFALDTDRPRIYFVNTKTHDSHNDFLAAVGLQRSQDMLTGSLDYHPDLVAPDGSRGLYSYRLFPFSSYHPFSLVARSYTVLAASMPLLSDNLAFNARNAILPSLISDLPLYSESRVNLVFDIDIFGDTGFLALNPGEGYGLLRSMASGDRANPRDVVIYEALPNDLPRVAGIISTAPQTPLSHVNLRAVQDGVPNAYIRDALDEDEIDDLIGSHVRYTVDESGWHIRAATRAEVDAHHAASRPAQAQIPQRDLSVMEITPLSEIGFEDWTAFGVKAANVAVLGTLGFPTGTVPDGFAIPFYFYDEFMKAHDFYTRIETMLTNEGFQTDFEVQDDMLDDLRDDIKDAETPQWIIDALTAMHATYPEGQSLRYRSSTNNEDLPGFNGAGLYDSNTQHPEETEEDGISKSLKQVLASLWNFRAFTERDFHRIDHLAAKMGVLVHPNYSDELANGVAVSFDTINGNNAWYYVNTQLGEDLVTNPDALSRPEEIRLHRSGDYYQVLATSNQIPRGQLLMSDDQLSQLARHLAVIHEHFEGLYSSAPGEPFAMEIEFKITSENILAIKQARPWIFSGADAGGANTGGGGSVGSGGSSGGGGGSGSGGAGGSGGGGGGGGGSSGPRRTVPDAPTNLVAEATDGAAVLRWEAPEGDGGAAISDYQYGINGRGWTSIGSTDTTYTVTGLVNGTLYVFQVRAVNRVGRSQPSDPAEATPRAPAVIDFTHFTNGDSTISEIVLVNVAPYPIQPTLYFYDQGGTLIDPESVVNITGDLSVAEDGSLSVSTEMESLGELTITTHGRGEPVSGSVRVVSDGPIGGFLRFDIPGLGVAGVGTSVPVNDALFPVRRLAGGINTGVALHNLGEEAMGVSCRLLSGGIALEAVEIALEANGQASWFIEDTFTATDTSDFAGSVRCTAPGRGRFTAIAMEIDAAGGIFTTLPVVEVNRGRAESTTLDFAHFANGAWITDLVFVNLETRQSGPALTPFHQAIPPTRPVIYFYDAEGNPIAPELVVDVTGDLMVTEGGALTVQTDMEPLSVLTISTHGRGEIVSGSAKVVSDGPIGGMLRFDHPALGVAGVEASPPVSDAIFPVRRQEGGITTGVALHNLESSPELVRCELRKEGVRLDDETIPLAANGQTAWFIDATFPGTDTSDFVGSMRCTATGEGLFSAVALELDAVNRIFTTLPVVPVPEWMPQE